MTNEMFDHFLDDATHLVADAWAEIADPLTLDDLYRLNDALTEYFASKR